MHAFTERVIGGRITFFQGLPSVTQLACASRHTLFGKNAPLGLFLIPTTLETSVLVRRRTRTRGVSHSKAFIWLILDASITRQAMLASPRGHPAILRPPFEERRVAPLEHCFTIFCWPLHPVLAAQIRDRQTAFGLAQDCKNLGVAISRHLHQNLLRYLAEKILLPHPLSFGGGITPA
jgi:hypothetical protein